MDILKKREAMVNAQRRFEELAQEKHLSKERRQAFLRRLYKEELSKAQK